MPFWPAHPRQSHLPPTPPVAATLAAADTSGAPTLRAMLLRQGRGGLVGLGGGEPQGCEGDGGAPHARQVAEMLQQAKVGGLVGGRRRLECSHEPGGMRNTGVRQPPVWVLKSCWPYCILPPPITCRPAGAVEGTLAGRCCHWTRPPLSRAAATCPLRCCRRSWRQLLCRRHPTPAQHSCPQ